MQPIIPTPQPQEPHHKLFDFLKACSAQREFPVFYEMFNKDLDYYNIFNQHKAFLQDDLNSFEDLIAGERHVFLDKSYIHINALMQDRTLKRALLKRYDQIPECYKIVCSSHPAHNCKLLLEPIAFALFLYYSRTHSTVEEAEFEDEAGSSSLQYSPEAVVEEIEEEINVEAEKVEASNLNVSDIRKSTLMGAVNIDDKDFEIDVENHAVPFLPTFTFEYVLLHDVQA